MPRLVHLAPESRRKAIERSGIRASAALVVAGSSARTRVPRAVYAMPVLLDFSVSYQWLRELRRWHGERMIAVHFVVPSDEPVLVGRYDAPHEALPLRDAIRRVLAAPMGSELVLTRAIRAREVVGIRDVTQLVGWTEVPEPGGAFDCLCAACVAPGTRDLARRVRAAYERHVLAARRGTTSSDVRRALANLETPLERARGRIAPDKLVAFTKSKDADVRRAAVALLRYFRWAEVEDLLSRALRDDHGGVRGAAVDGLVAVGGLRRAWRHVEPVHDDLVTTQLVEHLAFATDIATSAAVIREVSRSATRDVARSVGNAAERLLRDDDVPAKARATLEAVLAAAP